MITKVSVTTVMVLDQDQALEFYVDKLGFEVARDLKQGPFRWLTVRVPGDEGVEVNLLQPGPPVHDEAAAAQLRELIAKGAMSSIVLETDDTRGLYETLQSRGVTDFTQEPIEHGYGVDMGLRDPFGNGIRVLQPKRPAQRATA
jgi:catechol 2,3-dioxygenase-like lactoylglutathione lyase family enzyme